MYGYQHCDFKHTLFTVDLYFRVDRRTNTWVKQLQSKMYISVCFRWCWFILSAAFQRPEGPPLSRGMASEPQSRRRDQRKCKQVSRGDETWSPFCECVSMYCKTISGSWTNFILTTDWCNAKSFLHHMNWYCFYSRAKADEKTEHHLNPLKVLHRVDELMAEDSIIVADGGDFVGSAAYIMRPRGPMRWLDPG